MKQRFEVWKTSIDFRPNNLFSTSVAYTYTDAENKTTGLKLERRPRHRGSVVGRINPIEGLQCAITLVVVRDRIDSDERDMDNYERVDFAASYSLSENVKPFFRIDNVFDEDYEEVNGFETTNLAAYGGLEVSL